MRSALWPGPAPLDRRCRVPCAGWKATWSAVAGSTIWCGGLQGVSTSPPATATPPPAEPPPLARGNIYQKTKAEAEPLALAFHRQRGLPVAVVRPGAIYGPGETRLLKLFRAIARKRYAIVGSGRAFYHPVFIDDLVHGFLLALDRPQAVGEAFIVAGPRYVSQRELADAVARHTGGRGWALPIPARGRCNWRGRPARRCACPSASSRRCTGGAWSSGSRAGLSPSRRPGVFSATQ